MSLQTYRLKASLGKAKRIKTFWATDDTRAIGDGAMEVMRLAHNEFKRVGRVTPVWGMGKIVLLNSAGEILQTMEAKDE